MFHGGPGLSANLVPAGSLPLVETGVPRRPKLSSEASFCLFASPLGWLPCEGRACSVRAGVSYSHGPGGKAGIPSTICFNGVLHSTLPLVTIWGPISAH